MPAGQELVDDPFLTPVLGSQITRGDVRQTQLAHLDLGDVGILWMPGELPRSSRDCQCKRNNNGYN